MSNNTNISSRYFSKEHHWLEPVSSDASIGETSAEHVLRLGLTAFVVDQLGEITFLELPKVGTVLKTGDVLGSIESIKTISELYAPIDCVIHTQNAALAADPTIINSRAESDAWCVDIVASDPSQLSGLMDAAAYLKGQQ